MPNILCLAIDWLSAGYLGPLGNTWIVTPRLNELAADGFVFDRAIIDSPELNRLCRSFWHGVHALAPAPVGGPSLPEALRGAGYSTALWSDHKSVLELPTADAFARREFFESPPVDGVAEVIEETALADFFSRAAEALAELRPPFCAWLHVGSLGRVWDAPLELRQQYADEDDPSPPEIFTPPAMLLPEDFDPDELLGIRHCYAGQVSLLDLCVGSLLDNFCFGPHAGDTLVALVSLRGFPLGEHRRVGTAGDAASDQRLYGELVHTPWVVRLPGAGAGAQGFRSQALVQPPDLCATLADWALGATHPLVTRPGCFHGRSTLPLIQGELGILRDRACVATVGGERGLAAAAWYLRHNESSAGAGGLELFAKPDDWHEVNEVSSRCDDVVVAMKTALTQFEQACESGETAELPPLADSLAP